MMTPLRRSPTTFLYAISTQLLRASVLPLFACMKRHHGLSVVLLVWLAQPAFAQAIDSAGESLAPGGTTRATAVTGAFATPSAPATTIIDTTEFAQIHHPQLGADLVFELPLPFENGGPAQNRIVTREADVHLAADIDSLFDSYFDFRAHDDTGSFLFELREGWVANHAGTAGAHQFKLGKFALTLDEVNQMRPSERPFISSPFAQKTFFAIDQEVDTGLEYRWRGFESSHLKSDLYAGVTSGYCYGDCTPLSDGERPSAPVFYVRPSAEIRWSDSSSRIGAVFLDYSDKDSTLYQLFGIDELWTKGQIERDGFHSSSWLALFEAHFRSSRPVGIAVRNQEGAFALVQHAFTPRWLASLRMDFYTEPSLRDNAGDLRSNFQVGISPCVTYALSHHTQARMQYTINRETEARTATLNDQKIEFQFVTQIGSPDER